MASSLYPPSDAIATPAAVRPQVRVPQRGLFDRIAHLVRLLSEVWVEARAMEAEAHRRYPHMPR